jgi:hypothetical protein
MRLRGFSGLIAVDQYNDPCKVCSMPSFRFLLGFTIFVLTLPAVAFGYYQNPVNSQPGFTHSQKLQPDDTLAGKQLDGARIIRSSPVVGDLDGNPGNGPSVRSMAVLLKPNQTRQYVIDIQSHDGSPINVTITENDANNLIQLSHSNVFVHSTNKASLTIIISTSGKSIGNYTAQIILSGDQVPTVNIPITIRVVAEEYSLFIPNIVR